MDAGGTITIESTAANPVHVGGTSSEKLIKGETFKSTSITQFGTVALYFISENLAWAAMATFMAAINTATTTYNAAGPPKTIAHVTAWIQAVDAAATTANSSSQITNAALGATASASAVQAWYNALQSMLTIRAKGH